MGHRATTCCKIKSPDHINPEGKDDAGRTTGCSYWALVTQAKEWHQLWTDQSTAEKLEEALRLLAEALALCPSTLAPITAEDILEGSKAFKQATVAPDGFHPRSIGLLGYEARAALAALLNKCEAAGKWPTEASDVQMKATREQDGGSRLVGWYRAMFRLRVAIRGGV